MIHEVVPPELDMYTFEISDRYFSEEEKAVFRDFLEYSGIDEGVWDVFACLFKAKVRRTIPLLLRAYDHYELAGAAIIIKCSRYGRALYDLRLMARFLDFLAIPFYLWIKFGCCMDMMSNPGFVRDPEKSDVIHAAMARYLKSHSWMTMINDYTDKAFLYPDAIIMPALPQALVDTSQMKVINDYTAGHKNIKRKFNIFRNNGGEFHLISNMLDKNDIGQVRKCFISTAEKSIFYLPYEDLYLNAALTTSTTPINNVYYFIARLNGEFIGYQAALKTGNCLNALHGAFDRERSTTYHAYALLFVEMVRFAIEHNLKSIDIGAVLNITKQRMVNHTKPMSYYMMSKNPFVQRIFSIIAKYSKIQGEEQLRFYKEDSSGKMNPDG